MRSESDVSSFLPGRSGCIVWLSVTAKEEIAATPTFGRESFLQNYSVQGQGHGGQDAKVVLCQEAC